MSKKEKLIKRFLEVPKDFEYPELVKVLSYFGYEEFTGGKTSGSAVRFINPETKDIINIHKPHPEKTVKQYSIRDAINKLREEGKI